MNAKPLVSICCQTYNHKNYITQAIEGFLMQKTNFPFEILLRDDASTDGTTEIVKKYAKEYPDRIKPLIYKENQFVKGVKPLVDNMKRAKGKYIAICEGDDYWTDPYKLQKQVDFLENHSDYGLVHTDCSILFQETGKLIHSLKKRYYPNPPSGFIFSKLIKGNSIATLTVIVKTNIIIDTVSDLIKKMNINLVFDYAIWLEISRQTKIKYLNDITSVYRSSPNTVSRPISNDGKIKWREKLDAVQDFFINRYEVDSYVVNDVYHNRISRKLRLFYRGSEYMRSISDISSFKPGNFKDKLLFFLYNKNAKRIWYLLIEGPFIISRRLKKYLNGQ